MVVSGDSDSQGTFDKETLDLETFLVIIMGRRGRWYPAHKTSPATEIYLAQNLSRAEVETLWDKFNNLI